MRILYATDGSEGGLTPARFLASLPHRADIEVHLVTILATEERENGSAVLSAAKAALAGFPGSVTTEAVTTSAAMGHGSSTSETVDLLLTIADRSTVDLLTMGASGHSAIARFFLGSVAESVARHARYPVLITRPLTSRLNDVIIGVDGSDCGLTAAEFAASQLPFHGLHTPACLRGPVVRLRRSGRSPVYESVGRPGAGEHDPRSAE